MIVISGAARTGTSLMVQTLLLLGLQTPAKKFLVQHKNIRNHNRKGFYDLYHEVINGVDHDLYCGQALKMFPISLNQTDPELISKLIICKRNKADAVKSYIPVLKELGGDLTPDQAYNQAYSFLTQYAKRVNHIFINFEEINTVPEKVILKLCEFLEISPTDKQVKRAIKNVNHGNISRSSNRWGRYICLSSISGIKAKKRR